MNDYEEIRPWYVRAFDWVVAFVAGIALCIYAWAMGDFDEEE